MNKFTHEATMLYSNNSMLGGPSTESIIEFPKSIGKFISSKISYVKANLTPLICMPSLSPLYYWNLTINFSSIFDGHEALKVISDFDIKRLLKKI